MSQLYIEDYIKKLIMLERQVGAKTTYQIMEPFSLNSKDILAIQEAAKKIAEFVGLYGLTFIVAKAKQKEKVGGHIELQYGQKEVFVEISDDTAKFDVAVLATLAHEITHKYLQINGISSGTGFIRKYENEVLTDITAVFLGLGKLMLNGCEVKNTRQEMRVDGTYNVTKQLKSGYLDREQLAFIYRMVCAMRGISNQDMISGLSRESSSAIRACDYYNRHYFDQQFRTDQFKYKLVEALDKSIQDLQDELKQDDESLRFLQRNVFEKTKKFLEAKYKEISSLSDESKTIKQIDTYDSCLLFLNAIELIEKMDKMREKVRQDILEARKVGQSLNELTELVQKEELQKPKTKSFLRKIFSRRKE